MAKAIHSMIRILDEKRAVSFYVDAFGLTFAERLDFEKFTLVHLSNQSASFELELTINKNPYDLGNGYGQSAFYLEKSVKDYREGIREDRRMSLMTKSLSDEDIKDMAA